MVNRLRMVLMAERASMSPENFNLMKQSIVEAMREYVEVDEDEEVWCCTTHCETLACVCSLSCGNLCTRPTRLL